MPQLHHAKLRRNSADHRSVRLIVRGLGAVALMIAATPLLSASAKANLQHWANSVSFDRLSGQPASLGSVRGDLSQIAHTNTTTQHTNTSTLHIDQNQHSDTPHTDHKRSSVVVPGDTNRNPLPGVHVDIHTDQVHTNATTHANHPGRHTNNPSSHTDHA